MFNKDNFNHRIIKNFWDNFTKAGFDPISEVDKIANRDSYTDSELYKVDFSFVLANIEFPAIERHLPKGIYYEVKDKKYKILRKYSTLENEIFKSGKYEAVLLEVGQVAHDHRMYAIKHISKEAYIDCRDFANFGKSYAFSLKKSIAEIGEGFTEIDFLNQEIAYCNKIIDKNEHIDLVSIIKKRKLKFEKRLQEISEKPTKSKLDFTPEKLKPLVLELAALKGYDKPSTYLDELLKEVRLFKDFDFECSFFLNIHYLCKENASAFWSEGHRKDITQWLKKARIITDVFETTWEGASNATQVRDKAKSSTPNNTKKVKIKVSQIALIHAYNGQQITRENASQIAAKHGYTEKYSGEGLFQDYSFYCNPTNRKAKPTPCTPRKLRNKIELLESVIIHLRANAKQRALDEIQILKTIFESEFS